MKSTAKVLFAFHPEQPENKHSFKVAVSYAEKLNADLIVFTTYKQLTNKVLNPAENSRETEKNWQMAFNEVIGLRDRFLAGKDANYRLKLRMDYKFSSGNFAIELLKVISTTPVDLIILSDNNDPDNNDLLDQLVNRVHQQAPTDMLIMPTGYVYAPIKCITMIIDLFNCTYGSAIMDRIYFLANIFDSGINFLTTGRKNKQDKVKDQPFLKKIMTSTEDNSMYILEIMQEGTTVAEIKDYIKTNNIDVLCLMKRRQGVFDRFFQNELSHHISKKYKIPALILMEKNK